MAKNRATGAIVALTVLSAATFAQAPANDDCSGAIPIMVGQTNYDTTMATDGTGLALDPMVCDMGAFGDEQIYADIWYTLTAPQTGNYDFQSLANGGTGFDGRMALYNQSTCPDDPANVIACNDDASPTNVLPAMFGIPLVAGNTYLLRVGSYGIFTLEQPSILDIFTPPPPPANDACTNAAVAVLGTNAINNVSATTDGIALDPLVCSFGFTDEQVYQDIWYTFTPAATNIYNIEITNNGGTFDSRIAVYNQSTCPDDPANVIDCDDDEGDGLLSLAAQVPMTAGVSYLLRIGTFADTTTPLPTDMVISVAPPPPANDDCANAAPVTLGLTAFDSSTATNGAGLPLDPFVCDMGTFGDDQIYQDVWFSFTPTTTDFFDVASVNNGNAPFDSRIAVYDQSTCPDDPANVIGCDDDEGPILEALALGVSMTMGNTYLIRVGSYDDTTTENPAALSITIGVAPPAGPPNDDCANAQVITMHGTYAFDNTLATTSGPDLAGFCTYGVGDDVNYNDVWFEYTPAVGGCTYISTLNLAGFDTKIGIYETSTCPVDPATVVACSDEEVQPIASPWEAGLDVTLTTGVTYLINVGNFDSGNAGGAASLLIGPGPVAVNNDGGAQPGSTGCAPGPTFASFCNGDGGNQMGCTPCPCGNEATPGTIGGCTNSSGGSTAIDATGSTSVSLPQDISETSDLRLTLTGAPANAFCVMLSGGGVAPAGMANPCFGLNTGVQSPDRDGLRCAVGGGQALLRHGGRSANASGDVMDSTGPSRVWGGEAQPAAGIFGQAGFTAGQTRYFQVTHREDALAVCMRGLNTSQALEVTFTP